MPPINNNTLLRIGPLSFSHQVQKITIQESKSVAPVEATRSKKNFLIDSGDSSARAQIRLLFTGLDEINGNGTYEINGNGTYDKSFSPPNVSTSLSPTPENYLRRSKEYEDRLSSKKAQESQIKFLNNLLGLSTDSRLQKELIELQSLSQFGEDGRYRGEHEPRVLALLEVAKRNKEGLYSSIEDESEKLKKIKKDIGTLEKDIDFIAKTIAEKQNKFISPSFSTPASSESETYTTDSLSCLRGLIALFRCSPIINIENQYISSSWKKADKIYNASNYARLKSYLEQVSSINNAIRPFEQLEGLISETSLEDFYPTRSFKGTESTFDKTESTFDKLVNFGKKAFGAITAPKDVINRAAKAKNQKILQTINERLKDKQYNPVTPDILKGVDPFVNYSFGSVAFPDNFLKENVFYSKSISVALESIELESVPDIPQSIQLTLTIARIDTDPFTEGRELTYSGINRNGEPTSEEDPAKAYWLKKWITIILEKKIVPSLTEEDFKEAIFEFYGKTAIGTPFSDKYPEDFKLQLGDIKPNEKNSEALLVSESCSLRHRFAYNKIIGKIYPTAAHMGSTGRFLSLDIVFNNQLSYETYDKFCKFKYTADEINKERERFDRITGWEIKTPISKLLADSMSFDPRRNNVTQRVAAGVYVPLTISSETGDQPDMINARVDLIENNIDFFSDNEIILEEGSGTDYDQLEEFYFDNVVGKEITFRDRLVTNPSQALNDIMGVNGNGNYEAFSLFWPVEKGVTKLKPESTFGLLNIDTIRAVLMYLDDPSYSYGGTGKLKLALIKSPLASGELVANRRINLIDKVAQNLNFLFNYNFGLEAQDENIKNIYSAVKEIVETKFFDTADTNITYTPEGDNSFRVQEEEFLKKTRLDQLLTVCTNGLTLGLLGDRTRGVFFNKSATGIVVNNISKSNVKFSDNFKKALLRVLVERKAKTKGLPYIYSTDGLYSGFYKLILKYNLEKDKQPIAGKPDASDIVRRNVNKGSASVYPDILLPTYKQLYGDRWTDFAPTVEDLGIVVPVPDQDGLPEQPPLAVSEDDYVSPASWFYIKRNKKDLKTILEKACKAVNEVSPKLFINTPFNNDDIEGATRLLEQRRGELPDSAKYKQATESISKIIENAFTKQQVTDPTGFREDIVNITTLAKQWEKTVIDQDGAIAIQFQYRNTYIVPKEINVPGLAGEIVRVVSNGKFIQVNTPDLLDKTVEATYVTPIEKEAAFLRGSVNNTFATTKSCIDQIADDHTSPERMFPAIKVYLVDRRGNDMIADDTLFNVNAIVSVDITMDKDDAPVAVIRLADPLFFLQSSYFEQKNVVYGDKSKDSNNKDKKIERVFNSLRGPDRDSFLKRYKIAQGRAIQIRMGYSSMPFNLPIVFTGRIAEIAPGDELTIVCQGWKAELINRQVNFYNEDPKNWGARDLAIQAIQYANPDGFGDFFPEYDKNYILKNTDPADIEDYLENVMRNTENVDVEGKGSRTWSEGVQNWFSTFFTYTSTDKRDLGFDTRLKNIWYPDTQLYYNTLNYRSLFNAMPSWLNDSWIVPAQPSWDVLKEASRHAWNCIVDVVPYDSYATIFMGHPDMPYYYTKGNAYAKRGYRNYSETIRKKFEQGVEELLKSFYNSNLWRSGAVGTAGTLFQAESIINESRSSSFGELPDFNTLKNKIEKVIDTNGRLDETLTFQLYLSSLGYLFLSRKDLTNFSISYSKYKSFNTTVFGFDLYKANNDVVLDELFGKSNIPTELISQVVAQGVTDGLPELLFSLFYGIPLEDVQNKWPNARSEITLLLNDLSQGEKNQNIRTSIETLVDLTRIVNDPTELLNNLKEEIDNLNSLLEIWNETKKSASPYTVAVFLPGSVKVPHTELYLAGKKLQSGINIGTGAFFRKSVPEILNYLKTSFPSKINRITIAIGELRSLQNKIYSEGKKAIDELDFKAAKYMAVSNQIYNLLSGSIKENKINGVFSNLRATAGTELHGETVLETLGYFKGFVYYFCSFLKENESARNIIKGNAGLSSKKFLPPNMKVFRVHHFADDTHNILSNNIVASTKEMWNTVVIEHPSPGKANNSIEDETAFTNASISSGANWVYWPKQEITGVMGLQFNPLLTLANKKVKVFTELNCQSPDLAAKLACHHLAEGIKKMYRGNLSMLGKHMKPHDRIVLADKYTKMQGPVEIESLVHHWNADQGWVTNIVPNAVCESNPASAVLQMAALETTYQMVFNTIDVVSEVLTYATIIATLGAATPFALGAGYSTRAGAAALAKNILSPKKLLKATAQNWRTRFNEIGSGLGEAWRNGNTFSLLGRLYKETAGPVNSLLANEVFTSGAQWTSGFLFRHTLISSFIENQQKIEQLPVVFTPMLFNGNPFTAGLETEDSIWSIGSFGAYYSWKEMQEGMSRVWEDLFEEED